MRQFALVGGAFALTLAVLLGAWLALGAITGGTPAPTASPTDVPTASPAASPTEIATATSTVASSPTLGPSPSASATASPASSPTPTSSAAPTPTLTPVPSIVGGKTVVVTVRGQDYALAQGLDPPHATITNLTGGGIRMFTDGTTSGPLTVTYRLPALPPSLLPAGKTIRRIDVKVCGSGSGDFWEVYGPPGSAPVEYEAAPPAADGCWHFAGAPGPDSTVIADVNINPIGVTSTMQIDRLVYTVTVN
jgi:hypothetical protein